MAGNDPKREIEESLIKAGIGARIQICGRWNLFGNVGHTFVVEQRKNGPVYLDPQSGTEYNKDIITRIKDIRYWRIDNLEISDRGITACEKE